MAAYVKPEGLETGLPQGAFDESVLGNTNHHQRGYKVPTKRGSRSEDTALDTPMYVTPNGLELFQTNPTDQLFNRQQAPVVPQDA